MIWSFSDSGTEHFPSDESQDAPAPIVGDGLREISIPIKIGSNILWRGREKTLYVNVMSPDEWGNIEETDHVEHCRITLTNHSNRSCNLGLRWGEELAPGKSVTILDGELNHPSFEIYDLKLRKLSLEVKCEFSKPLEPSTTVDVRARW